MNVGLRISAILAMSLITMVNACRAADADALLDKAIQALGGAEKLEKVKSVSWTTKSTLFIDSGENSIMQSVLIQYPNHARQEFEGEFGGMLIEGVMVLAGDKGWRSFSGNVTELDKELIANEKRVIYLAMIPLAILPLKDGKFKLETIADEEVNKMPASGLKVIPPDGKEFKLYFDKKTGLPVRLVAKILGFMGDEFTQDTTFSDYKMMGGIQKATKIISKRDGEAYLDQQITEFKVLEKVDSKSFEPLN